MIAHSKWSLVVLCTVLHFLPLHSPLDLDRKLSVRRDREELIKQGIIQPTDGEVLELVCTYSVRMYMNNVCSFGCMHTLCMKISSCHLIPYICGHRCTATVRTAFIIVYVWLHALEFRHGRGVVYNVGVLICDSSSVDSRVCAYICTYVRIRSLLQCFSVLVERVQLTR